jgi:signal transduction histidine kinase
MKLSTQIILAFSIIILLSAVDSYINYLLAIRVGQNSKFLSRSEDVIRNSNRLHKTIIEMQSAFRGYLLTDDSTFLKTYQAGKNDVPVLLARQYELVKENIGQQKILDSIDLMHGQWLDFSRELIKARKEFSLSGRSDKYNLLFENKFKKQVGKKMNDTITSLFRKFDRNEYISRNVRSTMLATSIKHTRVFSVIFLTLTIIIGIASAVYIVTLISKRIASMVRLAENISKGQFTIVRDTNNDELTGLSKSLNIMSDRLSQNIHDLENRNTELNKFAYVVSHDLKAPVRGIHNVVKWIEEDLGEELSPQLKNYLRIIPQRTKRMEDLINGLLAYARISEKTPIELVDIHELVKEISEAIVPRHFHVELHNLPVLYSERIKLEQVFTNLISNAIKYNNHQEPRIQISCRTFPSHYEFSVKDNGIGIDPEYHDKIFEIFQTLRERDEKESTGVGLAIIKKIIEEHQSTIQVKSSKGKGAEFIFTWPRVKNSIS